MNQITAVMKMHFRDKMSWIYVPCFFVLLPSFFINAIVGYFVGQEIYNSGVGSIFIYMLVLGILTLTQSFSFALGFSVRRTDYFLGTVMMSVSFSFLSAIILYVLSLIEKLTEGWGLKLHFFHLPYLNDGTGIEQLLIIFIGALFMYFLGFTILSIYRRFGRVGISTFSITAFLLMTVLTLLTTYNHWWGDIFHWFSQHTAFELSLWMVPPGLLFMLASFTMLRRSTIS